MKTPTDHTPPLARACVSALSVAALSAAALSASPVSAEPSLRGSPESLDRQNEAARAAGLSKRYSGDEIRRAAEEGVVRRVEGGALFELHQVSYPYAHPDLVRFLSELARFYLSACGDRLIITSLMRPINEQPRNASDRSVHPTGIAVDLRYPARPCRARLEPALLSLERQGVIEATRERRPPHYHVTLNPEVYTRITAQEGGLRALAVSPVTPPPTRPQAPQVSQVSQVSQVGATGATGATGEGGEGGASAQGASRGAGGVTPGGVYLVAEGDTLWDLSVRWGISVKDIKRANRLRRDALKPGQRLKVPRARR